MGAESWISVPNCKAMTLRGEGTLRNIVSLKGRCATEIRQGRKEHHVGVLQRPCSFQTEQIQKKKKKKPTAHKKLDHFSDRRGIKLLLDNAHADNIKAGTRVSL